MVMKVRIKKAFRDVDTKRLMRVGEEANYGQDRALKLARSGYVVLLEKKEDVPTPEPVVDTEKEEVTEPEKHDFTPFPEKAEQPKRRGRKPKQ